MKLIMATMQTPNFEWISVGKTQSIAKKICNHFGKAIPIQTTLSILRSITALVIKKYLTAIPSGGKK